jgi:hypothetical protein
MEEVGIFGAEDQVMSPSMELGILDEPFDGFKFICCCLCVVVQAALVMGYWNRRLSLQKKCTMGGSKRSILLLNLSEMGKEIYRGIFAVLEMEM